MKNRSCINWRMLLQKVPILSSMARVKYAKNPHTKHCIWIKELWTFHLLTRKTFMNFDPTGFPRHTEFSPTVLMTLQIKKILHNVVRPFLKLHLIFQTYTIPNKFDKLPYDPEKLSLEAEASTWCFLGVPLLQNHKLEVEYGFRLLKNYKLSTQVDDF